jgi:hypothetical protein
VCVVGGRRKKTTFGLKLFPMAKMLGYRSLPLLQLEEVQHLQRWMSGEVLLDLPARHVRLPLRIRVVEFTEKKSYACNFVLVRVQATIVEREIG